MRFKVSFISSLKARSDELGMKKVLPLLFLLSTQEIRRSDWRQMAIENNVSSDLYSAFVDC